MSEVKCKCGNEIYTDGDELCDKCRVATNLGWQSVPMVVSARRGDGKCIFMSSEPEDDNWNRVSIEVDSDDCCSELAMAGAKRIESLWNALAGIPNPSDLVESHERLVEVLELCQNQLRADSLKMMLSVHGRKLGALADKASAALTQARELKAGA